jgi:hypothetical protein
MRTKTLTVILLGAIGVVAFYYGYKFGDRSKPYDRIFGLVTPESPTECGLPPGPTPNVILVGGCNRQEWTVERHRVCNVTPRDPYVYRWLVDEKGTVTRLPVIRSLQVNGEVPRMSKTFIQPHVFTPGWVSYRARVCLECPTDAFLMHGMVNPLHRIAPVCVDQGSTEYWVEDSHLQ